MLLLEFEEKNNFYPQISIFFLQRYPNTFFLSLRQLKGIRFFNKILTKTVFKHLSGRHLLVQNQNGNTRTMCEISSMLIIKTPERGQ